MKEKEKGHGEEDQSDEGSFINVDVTVHGNNIKGGIRLKRGATLQDLVDELIRRGLMRNAAEFIIMLDGRVIAFDPRTGRLSENPILAQSAVLSLLGRIKGGSRSAF